MSTFSTSKQLGIRLRKARGDARLTREQSSEIINVSPVTMWRYETGQYSVPLSKLHSLAEIYHRPMSWFLGDIETAKPVERRSLKSKDRDSGAIGNVYRTTDERLLVIREAKPFRYLLGHEMEMLAAIAELHFIQENQTLGGNTKDVGILTIGSGAISCFVPVSDCPDSGHQVELGIMTRPDCIFRSPRLLSHLRFRAMERTEVIFISRQSLDELCIYEPAFATRLLHGIMEYVQSRMNFLAKTIGILLGQVAL